MIIDLEAIRTRCEAATAPPWKVKTFPNIEIPGVFGGVCYGGYSVYNPPEPADAEFIAHAREDIPNLLAEIKRLQAIVTDSKHFRFIAGGGHYYTAERRAAIVAERDGLKAEVERLQDESVRLNQASSDENVETLMMTLRGAQNLEAKLRKQIKKLIVDEESLQAELERTWGNDGAPHESGDRCLSCNRLATESAFPYCNQCLLEGQLKVVDGTIELLHKQFGIMKIAFRGAQNLEAKLRKQVEIAYAREGVLIVAIQRWVNATPDTKEDFFAALHALTVSENISDASIAILTRIKQLQAAEGALEQSHIGGIYTEFENLPDAIGQMALHIKELGADKERLQQRLENALNAKPMMDIPK